MVAGRIGAHWFPDNAFCLGLACLQASSPDDLPGTDAAPHPNTLPAASNQPSNPNSWTSPPKHDLARTVLDMQETRADFWKLFTLYLRDPLAKGQTKLVLTAAGPGQGNPN